MAINETISTGNKYRRLKDAPTKLWQRLSFWTKASDVEFDNGATAEASLGNIQGITDSVNSNASNIAASAAAVNTLNSNMTEMQQSFQDGVDQIYNALVAKGSTPASKSLADVVQAINDLETDVKHRVRFIYETAIHMGPYDKPVSYAKLFIDEVQVAGVEPWNDQFGVKKTYDEYI